MAYSRGYTKDPLSALLSRDADNPAVDWLETPQSHVIKVDVPGLKKEDIKVEVEHGNVLRIHGARSQDDVKKTDQWHRVERSRAEFLRRFRLPPNVDLDKAGASVHDGVLQVTVPKVELKKPEVRSIKVKWGRSKL
eukprot:TRINITY_DN4301_c0_g1_i1.p1 TRINITY_DN4301_c0_g1~~TRINITY_DN4301_c0_g1_i1.p1  ORF type:complete len:136 (-),score=27.00 TRINITY_DN4301_c0_g1_i1:208-615(-)